jgi:hypothetical protein
VNLQRPQTNPNPAYIVRDLVIIAIGVLLALLQAVVFGLADEFSSFVGVERRLSLLGEFKVICRVRGQNFRPAKIFPTGLVTLALHQVLAQT